MRAERTSDIILTTQWRQRIDIERSERKTIRPINDTALSKYFVHPLVLDGLTRVSL